MDDRSLEIIEGITGLLPPAEFIFGFADLGGLLASPYDRYRWGASIAMKLDGRIIDGIATGPTAAYLDHYRAVNRRLEEAADAVAAFIERDAPALAMKPTFTDYELGASYRATLRTGFSHKMAATRSGLGWIGKCDLFVSSTWGPRVRLATVLTDCRLEPLGIPISESRCGTCDACVKACPAGAPSGREWHAGLDRDEFFDPFACMEKCRELTRERIGESISICGICVSVCPRGRGWK